MNILIGKMLGLSSPGISTSLSATVRESRKCRSNMVWRVEAEISPPLQATRH